MRFVLLAPISVAFAAFASCGGQVQSSTSHGGGTSTSSASTSSAATSGSTSSSSGSMVGHGCQSAADCGGKTCAPLTQGGYQVCLTPPAQATACETMMPPDQCCTSADCASKGGGSCYGSQVLQFCGGAQLMENVCVKDQCQSDIDCVTSSTQAICAPAGAFGNPERTCLDAYCKTDTDCKAKPGGACVLVGNNPCCKLPSPDGLGCVYPGGCVKDTDCPMNQFCHIDAATGTSACTTNVMGCPG